MNERHIAFGFPKLVWHILIRISFFTKSHSLYWMTHGIYSFLHHTFQRKYVNLFACRYKVWGAQLCSPYMDFVKIHNPHQLHQGYVFFGPIKGISRVELVVFLFSNGVLLRITVLNKRLIIREILSWYVRLWNIVTRKDVHLKITISSKCKGLVRVSLY